LTATEASSVAWTWNSILLVPGAATPGRTRTRTGNMRVPARSTSTSGADATNAPSIPPTLTLKRRSRSAVLITCSRTSRPSTPRSRITSTFSGVRSAMCVNSATVTTARIVAYTSTRGRTACRSSSPRPQWLRIPFSVS